MQRLGGSHGPRLPLATFEKAVKQVIELFVGMLAGNGESEARLFGGAGVSQLVSENATSEERVA